LFGTASQEDHRQCEDVYFLKCHVHLFLRLESNPYADAKTPRGRTRKIF
jgi:hypothetical protein